MAARFRDPLHQILLPQLQKRLAAAGSQRKSLSNTVHSASIGVTSAAPNFAGFNTPPYYPTIQETQCLADYDNCGVEDVLTADFNKDGKPDVAVVEADGTLNILLNNGTRGFEAPASYANPNYSSTQLTQAFVADFNNDGYPDIVAVDSGGNTLIAYPNLKNGTFGTPTITPFTTGFDPYIVAVGDVNGDGYPDVVIASTPAVGGTGGGGGRQVAVATNASNSSGGNTVTVTTYLGLGNFNFNMQNPPAQSFTVTPQVAFKQNAIALGDFNRDGKADIALELWEITNGQGSIVVTTALGNADGSFTTLNTNSPITGSFTPSSTSGSGPFSTVSTAGVKIIDLNNDSYPDLVADCNDVIYDALGNGSGGFGTAVQGAVIPGGWNIYEYEFADINNDGIPDIVEQNGAINSWLGKGDGTFTSAMAANGVSYNMNGGDASQILALADFNSDGNVDVAQLSSDYKQLSLFAGNGQGAFNGALSYFNLPFSADLPLQTVEDVQGKGYSSAVFVDTVTGSIITGLGDGKGDLTYVTGLPSSAVPEAYYIQPVATDLNGDGKQDILIVGYNGASWTLSEAFSEGDGTFQTPISLNLPSVACQLSYAAVGDINGDGIPDIVITYPGDSLCSSTVNMGSGYFVLLGTGGGNFAAPVFHAYGNELYSATIADINLDGRPDLILDDTPFAVNGEFAVYLLPGNGDGTFGKGSTVNSQNIVSQVIAGDYNQDGKPDLILFSEGNEALAEANQYPFPTGGILLLPGNGDGSFGAIDMIGSGNFFLTGALADVNNDGIPDLLASLYTRADQPNGYFGLSTLLGEGGGAFSNPVNTLQSMGSSWTFVGNFYADNAPDVLVQTGWEPTLFLGVGGTSLSMTTSAGSINFGDSETLTTTVAAAMAGRPIPTGSVSYYDGSTLLDTASLSGGSATFSTASLAAGTHSITAVYSGDANFNPATASSAVTVSVATVPPAFTLSSSNGSISLTGGQNGVATITLTANATFSGTVNLACSGAPANATCVINPTSVTLSPGSTGSASLIFGTTTAQSSNSKPVMPFERHSGLVSLAGLICVVAGWRSRKRLLLMVPLVVFAFSTLSLTGCGDDSKPTVAQGTYTVTVTATPASGTGSAQTATITVNVQ